MSIHKFRSQIDKSDTTIEQYLSTLLEALDPDMDYTLWVRVGMAVHHASAGSDIGLAIFDEWSSGGQKYPGPHKIERQWGYFEIDKECPITVGTIVWMINQGVGVIDD